MKRLVICLLSLPLLVSACGGETSKPVDRVRDAIRKTESRPRGFVYEHQDLEREVKVTGVLDDDYRYRVHVFVGGEDSIEEVGVDDAIAVRFLQPGALDALLSQSAAAAPRSGTELELLRTGRWVVDLAGAPEITSPKLANRALGADPVLDALTAFGYVQRAMREAETVNRFNPEAVDYIAREDKFPKPEQGSPVVRYDLRAPPIPPFTTTAGGRLPEPRHFRRMSIYIKDGLVLQVLEEIDIATRYDRLVEALNLKIPPGLTQVQRLSFAMEALNQLRATRGLEPIRIRRLSIEMVDVGKRPVIEVPKDALTGNLSVLPNRGRSSTSAQTGR